jgi:sigma-B regulation protein RsbU (phosphoserine phosphatase)
MNLSGMSKKNLLLQLNFAHISLIAGVIFILLVLGLIMNFVSVPIFVYLLVGFLLFALTIVGILSVNSKFLKPFSEIFASIRSNNKNESNLQKYDDDYELIVRYITSLENQLDFYEKKIEKISVENKGLENDLKLARRLQKNLFPTNIPFATEQKKFEVFAFSESAYEIGGDLYDCFLIDDDHLLVAVGDVAGKGIAASLYMIYTHTLLHSIVKPGLSVNEITDKLNNQLIEENISDMFVTLFLGVLTLSNGQFEYCNAAHNLPCMISANGNIAELPETHGIPIGIYPDRSYQSTTISFSSGDQIFIYTDGLTDTVDENGLKYSTEVLKYNLMGTWFFNPSIVTERIKESVNYFRGNKKPVDDMTLVTIKYTPDNTENQDTSDSM